MSAAAVELCDLGALPLLTQLQARSCWFPQHTAAHGAESGRSGETESEWRAAEGA